MICRWCCTEINSIAFYIQVQAIVDHHHGTDNARTATKVRFTEPNDVVNEDEDEGSLEKVDRNNNIRRRTEIIWNFIFNAA